MRRTIWIYGLMLGVLVVVFKTLEYKWLIKDLSWQWSLSLVAVLFMGLGIWFSQHLNKAKAPDRFKVNQTAIDTLGLSTRELAVLEKLTAGLSNQQIADALFVSVNTVKTHLKNAFTKLEVNSRVQAINKLKALQIVP
ncbi:LuxR C-terminal-related transcriptional regulator [Marinicella sediminis]|uniref:LuxR C-terminal-related transcriptional regulator n=1 Tax=Marinicella sediminis TaxID=1792834 RepID=A0ABV7JEA9_9GAMM|nr:LuxR C-terminal-related transcriptional regulator [Marinicella sediminis]